MSKFVKDLVTKDIAGRLEGVSDALLVNMIGLDANKSVVLRRNLRAQNIRVLVVKNTLARRATEGTPLAAAFEKDLEGSTAVCWGSEDIISLAKVIAKLHDNDEYKQFEIRGGAMDGQRLSPEDVKAVSKWPGRAELLSLVAGQATGIGSTIAGQIVGPAMELASQVEKLIEMKEKEATGGESA